jgi:hypothetical protein
MENIEDNDDKYKINPWAIILTSGIILFLFMHSSLGLFSGLLIGILPAIIGSMIVSIVGWPVLIFIFAIWYILYIWF